MITPLLLTLAVTTGATLLYSPWHYRSLFLSPKSCPRCKLTSLSRSPRNQLERLVGYLVNSKKFRCSACGWTGLLRATPGVSRSGRPTLTDAEPTTSLEIPIPSHLQGQTNRA